MSEKMEVLARGQSPKLGGYLRELRKAQGLTLRVASSELGMTFTRLQKWETGGRVSPPTLEVLRQFAAFYDRSVAEVFAAAGVNVRVVEDDRDVIARRFRALVLHPKLCPLGMDEPHWLASFSTRQMRQWIDFAHRLQQANQEGIDIDIDQLSRDRANRTYDVQTPT